MSARQLLRSQRTWAAAGIAAAIGLPVVAYADKGDKPEKKEKEEASRHAGFFDPEALERGAKALREINASPNAKQVLEIQRQNEITKQQESKEREADYKRQAAHYAKEQEQVRWEEQRKTMADDAQRKAQLAQYNDELARKRLDSDHQMQRQRNAELVKMQEESGLKREQERLRIEQQIQAERRAADQYAAELQKQVQRERALSEAEGRIKENRANEDINRRAAILRYQEETKKAIESINTVFGHLGRGATALLTDYERLATVVAGFTALALGVYGAREGTRVAGKALERWLGTPKLVRETSRAALFGSKRGLMPAATTTDAVAKTFSDVILPDALHTQVRTLAAVTANTKAHGAPFRHMLFYGPPGTGKTLAAKRLARTSGLDYAILSGGDIAPLGAGAVTQLHAMFDWAERSQKGLLLFIDEADAFLGRRSDSMSEGLRGALNALLFRTGDQSRDFMVVLATNRPGDLDDAVLDRMDEALYFGLPDLPERRRLLSLYLDRYIARAGTTEGGAGTASGGTLQQLSSLLRGRKASVDEIQIQGVDDRLLDEAAKLTHGFSGREIAKLLASVQAAVYGSTQAVLTPTIFRDVLNHKLHEHRMRAAFRLGHHGTGDPKQDSKDQRQG